MVDIPRTACPMDFLALYGLLDGAEDMFLKKKTNCRLLAFLERPFDFLFSFSAFLLQAW